MAQRKSDEVYGITSAAPSLSDDQSGRQRRYLFSMGLRTACFLLAVATPSPWRWFFLLGAVTLPYFAVIIANAGREKGKKADSAVNRRELSS